tara:strand:- start:349 stop:537 length:189 start_codon:yes stop_codon:yes gene_type:complete
MRTVTAKRAIGFHELNEHGRNQSFGFDSVTAAFCGEGCSICDEVAMDWRRQLNSQLDRLLVN